MKLTGENLNTKITAESAESWSTPSSQKVYRELADTTVVELDALAQLDANLDLLEGLQKRLSFLMREVRVVLKVEDPV